MFPSSSPCTPTPCTPLEHDLTLRHCQEQWRRGMQFQSLFSQGFSTKVSKHLDFQSPTKFPKFSNVSPSSSKLSKSSQQFPLCPKHLHFPKLSKVFQHVPKFSNIESFPKLEKFGNLWFSWVFQSFPKFSKVFQSFPKFSKAF